jgi:hypothetical protein
MSTIVRKSTPWIALAVSIALLSVIAGLVLDHAHLIKLAANIQDHVKIGDKPDGKGGSTPIFADDNENGLGKFIAAADALLTPAAIAMAAVAPLACLVGAGAMLFGSRRGLVIVGAALGTLVFVVSIKGIVA